jgi:hypothetical protein
VARTGKRVTASLLSDVTRRLPPLTSDASPAEIGQMVRGILAPPPGPEAVTDTRSAGDAAGEQSPGAVADGSDGPVHNITTIGGNADSPIGESDTQADNAKGSAGKSDDLERLNETLALLREAARGISKPAVRRALDADPAAASALLNEIAENLNKVGRTVAVQRPA